MEEESHQQADCNGNAAKSDLPTTEESDEAALEAVIKDTTLIFELLICNKFEEAFKEIDPKSESHFLYAYGKSTMLTIAAVMTFKKNHIERAIKATNRSLELTGAWKKSPSFSSLLFSEDYSTYSDVNCHAGLAHGEGLALSALLTVIDNPSIPGLIKGAIKIRSCHQMLREGLRVLETKNNWKSEVLRRNFESGVYLGLGLFEMAISFFPSRFITMLEIAGFSGDGFHSVNAYLLESAKIKEGNQSASFLNYANENRSNCSLKKSPALSLRGGGSLRLLRLRRVLLRHRRAQHGLHLRGAEALRRADTHLHLRHHGQGLPRPAKR